MTKRLVLAILALLLLVDLAEDGCLGKATVYLPCPSAKTTVTSSHHPCSAKIDLRLQLASPDLPESPQHDNTKPGSLRISSTLLILHCCHFNSAGGIPL
jgi:hypothetical protein